MALLDSEVAAIKAALGYNVLSIGAEPYADVRAYFTQVMQPYLSGGATTSSSTAVTAATSPTPVVLTLADATGFALGDTVIVDVDSLQESATVRAVSGSTVTVLLSKAHSLTYPVTVEGPETLVRAYLRKLRSLSVSGGAFDGVADTAGIKKVDEIEFFGGAGGGSTLRDLRRLQNHYRDELAALLGIPNMHGMSGGGSSVSPY